MPINDPSAQQTSARWPLVRVLHDGQLLAGCVSAEIEQNSFYSCDHFHLEFAASASQFGWWDMEPPLVLDIQISNDQGNSWTPILTGEVDEINMNWEGGTLTMQGRDLSSRLVETKTQMAFVNQTSSQIIENFASEHGILTQITPTTTLVGRYYESDHVEGSLDQFARTTTEWDFAVYLAQREGFDVFTSGRTLFFQPITPPNADPFVIRWTPPSPIPRLNTVTLRCKRSLTLAKDIEVWVRSWGSQQGRAFTKRTRAAGTKASAASASSAKGAVTTQRYVFVKPNLTEQDAQAMANQLAVDLTKHERVVSVEMPGELVLTPRSLVRLEGTGSSFDQTYYIDSISRAISFEGFTQSIRMKNSSPRSQTQLS